MRIGIFTATFLPKIGGTETSVDRLARHLIARGHHVVVITHQSRGQPLVDYPVFLFKRPRLRRMWPGVFALPIKRAWIQHRFDVLLCMNANPTAYGGLWARRIGARFAIVACPRGIDLYPSLLAQRGVLYRHFTRHAYRSSDRIIAISSFMRSELDRFVGPPLPPIDMIFTGVDLDEQAALRESARVAASHNRIDILTRFDQLSSSRFIVHMARICDYKRQHIAVEAVGIAADALRAAGVKYVLAGDGPMMGEIVQQIQRLGVGEIVLLPGMVREPDRSWLLNQAMFYVSTSSEEGMPNAVLEAIAQGAPVLASDISPHHDILDDRSCGRFFRTDDAADLAAQLIAMLDADLPGMRIAARRAADQMSIQRMVDGYEASLAAAIRLRADGSAPRR